MSRLIDKLNQVSQTSPQPIGFRTQPVSAKPKMLLIACLTQANIDRLADYVAGADGGLLPIHQSSEVKVLKKISEAVANIPWGVWLKDGGRAEMDEIVKVGCDFVVFAADSTSLAMPPSEPVGRIIEVYAPALSDGLLRAIDDLPVDAVLIAEEPEEKHFLTWHDLILFQHFANLLTKPLLVSIPSNVTANELQALWAAGVDGVIAEVGVDQPVGTISQLRQAIDKLTLPPQRKPRKAEALLPPIGQERGTVTEEE